MTLDGGYNSEISKSKCWLCGAPLEEFFQSFTCAEVGCDEPDCGGHGWSDKRCLLGEKHHAELRRATLEMAKQQEEEAKLAGKA